LCTPVQCVSGKAPTAEFLRLRHRLRDRIAMPGTAAWQVKAYISPFTFVEAV